MSANEEFIDDFGKILKKYQPRMEKMFKQVEGSLNHDPDVNKKISALKDLYREAEKIFEELKNTADEDWDAIHEKAVEILKSLKDSFYGILATLNPQHLSQLKDEAIEIGQEQLHALEKYMEKKPFLSVFVALGVGFCIGLCVGGGRK